MSLIFKHKLLTGEKGIDEVNPLGVGGSLVELRAKTVDEESGCGVHIAIGTHLDTIVSQVKDRIASHLGIEGRIVDTPLLGISREERVQISLSLSIEGSLREAGLVLPHVVKEGEQVVG